MGNTGYEFSSFTRQGGRHTKKEIIGSLKRFQVVVGRGTFTQKEYDRWDKRLLCSAQIRAKFGTWALAVEAADLIPAWNPTRDRKEMIQIFMNLWKEDDEIPSKKRLEQRLLALKVPHTANLYKKYFGGLKKLAANVKRLQSGEIDADELAIRHDLGQDKTYTVYCLYSTRDGIRRYVGETRSTLERRLAQHHSAAIKKGDALLYKWIRAEGQDGFEIKIACLEKGAEYRRSEKKWIAKLVKEGVPLLNGNGKYLPAIRGEKD